LRSKGEQQVNLRQFANLPPGQVSFVPQTGRLTNLKQLTVDTSWWTRYRSTTNPDFGATFPNAVPSLDIGLHTAIPRNDGELGDRITLVIMLRPSLSRPDFTLVALNKVARAFTRLWLRK
jgi:hypothetical protein